MIKLKAAFATDNGKTFMVRHFGDADFFDIYEIENDQANFIKRISNSSDEEEEVHADPKKAKGITNLLQEEDIKIVVSKIFGPNIKRIRKKFVCIVVKDEEIDKSIIKICHSIDRIHEEWEKGIERKHISL